MMNKQRIYSRLDRLVMGLDSALRALAAPGVSSRPHPDAECPESDLTPEARRQSQGMMRVNHTGEVCAQALYHGQLLGVRSDTVATALRCAAIEETDHLAWTAQRLDELGTHTSYLNPLWYGGSFVLGVLASVMGDAWSLGFVEETERQVGEHLNRHLGALPKTDQKSRAIVAQMKIDEAHHGATAQALGAKPLPRLLQGMMTGVARVMTATAYYV